MFVNPYSRTQRPPPSRMRSVCRSPWNAPSATRAKEALPTRTPALASACAPTAWANPEVQGTGPP